MRSRTPTPNEDELILKHYAELGPKGMHGKGILKHWPRSRITERAHQLEVKWNRVNKKDATQVGEERFLSWLNNPNAWGPCPQAGA